MNGAKDHYRAQAVQVLRTHGHRITKPRLLVIDLLDHSSSALSAAEIRERLIGLGAHLDLPSIYRIIECLEANGLVHRMLETGKVSKCSLSDEEHCDLLQENHCHHLLVCRVCGDIREFHCSGMELLSSSIASEQDFAIEQHRLEFTGVCARCRPNRPA